MRDSPSWLVRVRGRPDAFLHDDDGTKRPFDTFTKNPVVTTPVVTVASQPTTLASAQLPAADTTIQSTQLPAATITTIQTPAATASKSGLPKWSYWAMGGGAVLLLLIVIGVASQKPKKAAAPIRHGVRFKA